MYRSIRPLLAVASAGALLAGFASSASADMTMSVGTPSLTSKVLVDVPITASCSPFDPSLTPYSSGASVSIEQAVGKSIARGSGYLSSGWPSPLAFPCDGADHTLDVGVVPDPAGPPFRHGDAAVRASATAYAAIPCPWSPGCFYGGTSQSANVGPIAAKIH